MFCSQCGQHDMGARGPLCGLCAYDEREKRFLQWRRRWRALVMISAWINVTAGVANLAIGDYGEAILSLAFAFVMIAISPVGTSRQSGPRGPTDTAR